MKQIAEKYGFLEPGFLLVSFNGGLIYDCGEQKPILTRYIPVDEVKAIMDAAHARGMHAHTYSGDLVVSEYETEQLKTYCRLMKMDYVVVKDIREYYGEFVNVVVKPPIKVNIITPFEHSGLVDFRADMRKTTAGKLFDVFSKPEMLEFSHMQSNKVYGGLLQGVYCRYDCRGRRRKRLPHDRGGWCRCRNGERLAGGEGRC